MDNYEQKGSTLQLEDEEWMDDYEHHGIYDADAEVSVDSFGIPRSVNSDHGTSSSDSFPMFDESKDFISIEFCLPLIGNDAYVSATSHSFRSISSVYPQH